MLLKLQFSGTVRLTSGNHGRVEILYSGSWGTVCDNGFTDSSARLAFSSRGYWHKGGSYSLTIDMPPLKTWVDLDLTFQGHWRSKKSYGTVGLAIYELIFVLNSNMCPNAALLQYIGFQNVSNLGFDLSRSLKIRPNFRPLTPTVTPRWFVFLNWLVPSLDQNEHFLQK